MTSGTTDSIPAAQPGPETAQQTDEDRLVVRAVGLAKSYGPTLARAGLDLDVAAGETVALLGPNGAGKTTTIGLLLGLLSPSRGQVQVHGLPSSQAVADGLVGAMLQDAGLMPGVRVGELLAMVRGLCPRPLPLDELVGIADLGSLLRRRADRLSGGQAQQVRFAVAIAGDPLLLVLDEPTAAMDVQARRNFWLRLPRRRRNRVPAHHGPLLRPRRPRRAVDTFVRDAARHAADRTSPAIHQRRRAGVADRRRPGLGTAGRPGTNSLDAGQRAGRTPRLPPPRHRVSQLNPPAVSHDRIRSCSASLRKLPYIYE